MIWCPTKTPGSFRVCSRYISLPNPTTQRRDIKKSERHGFLYLRITVNPRGFHLILPMKFDKSEDETQKHNDAKGAHYITSFQLKICSTRPGSSLIPSQSEKINKRIMMITMNIPPPSFVSFIDLLDNSHRTNNIIKLPSPPFIYQQRSDFPI